MGDASSAAFPPQSAARLWGPKLVLAVFGIMTLGGSLGCAPSDEEEDQCEPYSCSCGTGVRESAPAGQPTRCVGSPFCNDESDCPQSQSGTSEPVCESFGDQIINGYTGGCRLPCTTDDECPDGAFCDSFCWFEAED